MRSHYTEMHGFNWVVCAGIAGWCVFGFGLDPIMLEHVALLVMLVNSVIPAIQETTSAAYPVPGLKK